MTQKSVVVKGRLTGPRTVELEDPVSSVATEVEVVVHPYTNGNGEAKKGILAFLQELPPGTRSKEEIDAQIRAERESWGDR